MRPEFNGVMSEVVVLSVAEVAGSAVWLVVSGTCVSGRSGCDDGGAVGS